MLVEKLTQKQVSKMKRNELQRLADKYQDALCNIDYLDNEELYDRIAGNLNLIESKLLFNEF